MPMTACSTSTASEQDAARLRRKPSSDERGGDRDVDGGGVQVGDERAVEAVADGVQVARRAGRCR